MALPGGITANPDGTYTDQSGRTIQYNAPIISGADESGNGAEVSVPERWSVVTPTGGLDEEGNPAVGISPYVDYGSLGIPQVGAIGGIGANGPNSYSGGNYYVISQGAPGAYGEYTYDPLREGFISQSPERDENFIPKSAVQGMTDLGGGRTAITTASNDVPQFRPPAADTSGGGGLIPFALDALITGDDALIKGPAGMALMAAYLPGLMGGGVGSETSLNTAGNMFDASGNYLGPSDMANYNWGNLDAATNINNYDSQNFTASTLPDVYPSPNYTPDTSGINAGADYNNGSMYEGGTGQGTGLNSPQPLNGSIYQQPLQYFVDQGIPSQLALRLPSIINSAGQGAILSKLMGGSALTGAEMGALGSVVGNALQAMGINAPTTLVNAFTSLLGKAVGLGGLSGSAGTGATTRTAGGGGGGGGISPDMLKNALASLQPPQGGASPLHPYLQPSLLNTQGGGGSPLSLWQGLSPAQTQIRAKTGGSISELADRSGLHPALRSVLRERGYGVDFVPGPEDKLYAKHDVRGFAVGGPGTGQSDDIPTMLSDGEYVIDADTVAALGDGSSKAGASVLDKMREKIRQHKRSASIKNIPPKAKSPLEYLKGNKHG